MLCCDQSSSADVLQVLLQLLLLPVIELGRVVFIENLIDQSATGGIGLVVSKMLGLVGVKPKTNGDQHEDAGAEEKTAFSLQARFAQQAFEGAIRHKTALSSQLSDGAPNLN